MYDNTTNVTGNMYGGTLPMADNTLGIDPATDNAAPQKGWLCPRCDRINAPQVLQCTCHPHRSIQTNSTGTTASYTLFIPLGE